MPADSADPPAVSTSAGEDVGGVHGLSRIALHLAGLTGVAVAQPVFAVYQKSPDIFIARSTPPAVVIMLALLLAFGLPAAMWGIVVLAGAIRRHLVLPTSSAWVGLLVAALVLQVSGRVRAIPLVFAVVIAVIAGFGAGLAYARVPGLGGYLTFLSPASVVFLGLFLFTHPMSALLFAEETSSEDLPVLSSDAPVIFILFDEMPLVSLLNSAETIDALRYPNLARLADDGTWFRNSAAAHPFTTRSIPALLSGELPDPGRLATSSDYPNNIFTLFGSSHSLDVWEPLTNLCPPALCGVESPPIWTEIRELSRVTVQLYQRIVAPQLFDDVILTIDDPFDDLAHRIDTEIGADQQQRIREFIDGIDGSDRRLHFAHFFLPHAPFYLLPSGRSYNGRAHTIAALDGDGVWQGDPWNTFEQHQRHLLQVGAVDRLVGELIDHLQSIGAYEKTMIVITSDHGVAHMDGLPRRDLTEDTLFDIALVPLIVKAPGQVTGGVDDRLVQAVDVLPTIVDLLGGDRPWPGEGISLATGDGRSELVIRSQDNLEITIDVRGGGRREAIQRVIDRFGTEEGERDLFAFGPFADLVGKRISSFGVGHPDVRVLFDEPTLLFSVDPESGYVPAYVRGRLEGLALLETEPHLALVLNGVVGAVVPLHDVDVDSGRFAAVLDDSLFEQGYNSISVLAVFEGDEGLVAREVFTDAPNAYTLERRGGVEVLVSFAGVQFAVDPDAVVGYVDSLIVKGDTIVLGGWAVDSTLFPVQEIVLFSGGRFVSSVLPGRERVGLAEELGESVLLSGFELIVNAEALVGGLDDLLVYGVSEGGATALTILGPALEVTD